MFECFFMALIIVTIVLVAVGAIGFVIMFLPTVLVFMLITNVDMGGFGLILLLVTFCVNIGVMLGFTTGGNTNHYYQDDSSYEEGYMDGRDGFGYMGDGDNYDEGYYDGRQDSSPMEMFAVMSMFDAIDHENDDDGL